MTPTRTALVVEDEPLLCSLIARLLADDGFEVVEACSAMDAFTQFTSRTFDLIVADIDLGTGPNGIDVVQRIRTQSPDVGVVFLTNLRDPRISGASWAAIPKNAAYLVKSELGSPNALSEAVASALSPAAKGLRPLPETSPLRNLSDTQVTVLTLVAEGKTNEEIAAARDTSVRAVEKMLQRISAALELDPSANGRVALARYYWVALHGRES